MLYAAVPDVEYFKKTLQLLKRLGEEMPGSIEPVLSIATTLQEKDFQAEEEGILRRPRRWNAAIGNFVYGMGTVLNLMPKSEKRASLQVETPNLGDPHEAVFRRMLRAAAIYKESLSR